MTGLNDLDEIEEDLTELNIKVDQNTFDIDVLDASFNTLKANVSALDASMNLLEGQLSVLDTSINLVEGQLSVLDTSMNVVEGQLSVLDTSMNFVEGQLSVLDASMNIVESNISALDASMNSIDLELDGFLQKTGGTITGNLQINGTTTALSGIDVNGEVNITGTGARLTTSGYISAGDFIDSAGYIMSQGDLRVKGGHPSNTLTTTWNSSVSQYEVEYPTGTGLLFNNVSSTPSLRLLDTGITLYKDTEITGDLTVSNPNEITYKSQTLDNRFVNVAGDTMTNNLSFSGSNIGVNINSTTAGNTHIGGQYNQNYLSSVSGTIIRSYIVNTPPTPNTYFYIAEFLNTGITLKTDTEITGNLDVGGDATINNAHVGVWSSNSAFACFSHETKNTTGGYALLQSSNGATYLNSNSGSELSLRQGNSSRLDINSSGDVEIANRLLVDDTIVADGIASPFGELDIISDYVDIDGSVDITGTASITGTTTSGKLKSNELEPSGFTANYLNYISMRASTNLQSWIRFRGGGGNPVGETGVIFGRYDNNNYFMRNAVGVLKINFSSTTLSNTNAGFGAVAIGATRFQLYNNGNLTISGNLTEGSDDRIKRNEKLIENATETLLKLTPQIYDKGEDPERTNRRSGLIAQDVFYDVPELRHLVYCGDKEETGETDVIDNEVDRQHLIDNPPIRDADIQIDPNYTALGWGKEGVGINYTGLIAYLIKSNQELHHRIQMLERNV